MIRKMNVRKMRKDLMTKTRNSLHCEIYFWTCYCWKYVKKLSWLKGYSLCFEFLRGCSMKRSRRGNWLNVNCSRERN